MPDYLLAYFMYKLYKDHGIKRVPLKVVKELFDEEDIETIKYFKYVRIVRGEDGRKYLEINTKKEGELKRLEEILKSTPLFTCPVAYVDKIIAELIADGVLKPQHSSDESESVEASN